MRRTLPLLALLSACVPGADDPPDTPIVCEAPWDGAGTRLSEEGAARGLTDFPISISELAADAEAGTPPILAFDLDADGDVDIVQIDPVGGPMVYANDGAGRFTRLHQDWGLEDAPTVLADHDDILSLLEEA